MTAPDSGDARRLRLVRRIGWGVGRVALGAVFVRGGSHVFGHPDGPAVGAGDFLARLKAQVPVLAEADDRQLVQLNAAAQVGAGLALATGRLPRLAAAVLAASLVPTTLAAFPFWEKPPGPERGRTESDFLKNLALFGGLIGVISSS